MESGQEATFTKIKDCLVAVLGIDDDEVEPDKSLIDDLGAESIDFVDIIFRLEKSFSIKIPRGELFPQDILSNKEFIQDGKFTTAGLATFKSKYPFIDVNSDGELPVSKLPKLYTVQMLMNYIDFKKKGN